MAIIKCKNCGKQFSDTANFCPNFGCPKSKKEVSHPVNTQNIPVSSYVKGQIIKGEQVVYSANIHWQIWIMPVFWTLLLGLPILLFLFSTDTVIISIFLLVIVSLSWLSAIIKYAGTDLVITNKRVIAKFGFIRRNSFEIKLNKIEGCFLHQSLLGRIFDCSTIIVSGTGTAHTPIPYIADGLEFKKVLMDQIENAE